CCTLSCPKAIVTRACRSLIWSPARASPRWSPHNALPWSYLNVRPEELSAAFNTSHKKAKSNKTKAHPNYIEVRLILFVFVVSFCGLTFTPRKEMPDGR